MTRSTQGWWGLQKRAASYLGKHKGNSLFLFPLNQNNPPWSILEGSTSALRRQGGQPHGPEELLPRKQSSYTQDHRNLSPFCIKATSSEAFEIHSPFQGLMKSETFEKRKERFLPKHPTPCIFKRTIQAAHSATIYMTRNKWQNGIYKTTLPSCSFFFKPLVWEWLRTGVNEEERNFSKTQEKQLGDEAMTFAETENQFTTKYHCSIGMRLEKLNPRVIT